LDIQPEIANKWTEYSIWRDQNKISLKKQNSETESFCSNNESFFIKLGNQPEFQSSIKNEQSIKLLFSSFELKMLNSLTILLGDIFNLGGFILLWSVFQSTDAFFFDFIKHAHELGRKFLQFLQTFKVQTNYISLLRIMFLMNARFQYNDSINSLSGFEIHLNAIHRKVRIFSFNKRRIHWQVTTRVFIDSLTFTVISSSSLQFPQMVDAR
jgi:hypothetical protein